MENCAKCGKELLWNEKKMVFWNKQLQKGYIKWMVPGFQFGKKKEFPEYTGKKLCQDCAIDVFEKAMAQPPTTIPIEGEDFADLKKSLTENGIIVSAFNCSKCDKMNDIPETGKLLICKHCGNPIKPKDIYTKIKEITK